MEFDIWTIISAILGLATVVIGGFWLKVKGKLSMLGALIKETLDVIDASIRALEDNKITSEEAAMIKKEALEVKTASKKLMGT